jgi:UDP-3-O-[3-hydroxymyristoyl] N-acetylglucosamine deacetylase
MRRVGGLLASHRTVLPAITWRRMVCGVRLEQHNSEFGVNESFVVKLKQGTVGSGYLNSHIILHDNKVINTELRFPDEFVRHKILDLLGDLFLIGHSVRGRVVANMTSHGYNQALVQKLHQSLASTQS